MNTAVAVRNEGSFGIDPSKVNYGLAMSKYDAFMSEMGTGSSGSRAPKMFPGEQVVFKKGIYYIGIKDQKRKLKDGTRLILNAPNMIAVWCTWKLSDTGKKYPTYTEPRYPSLGHDPIKRETLGNTKDMFALPAPHEGTLEDWVKGMPISEEAEEAGWEISPYGTLEDPTKPMLVFPIRPVGTDVVNHLILSSTTACRAGFDKYKEIVELMKTHHGQLPVIEIGTDKKPFTKMTTDKRGKERKEENIVDIPEFKIVDWVDADDIDNPTSGGKRVTAEAGEAADLGVVTAKSRVNGNGKANGKAQKLLAAPVKGKAKSRKAIEVADDDEAPL